VLIVILIVILIAIFILILIQTVILILKLKVILILILIPILSLIVIVILSRSPVGLFFKITFIITIVAVIKLLLYQSLNHTKSNSSTFSEILIPIEQITESK